MELTFVVRDYFSHPGMFAEKDHKLQLVVRDNYGNRVYYYDEPIEIFEHMQEEMQEEGIE